jgi:PAS domain S-box-containing protein
LARFYPNSITKQFWLTILIVAIPACLAIVYSGVEGRNEDISTAREEIRILADAIASEQKNLVAGAQQLISALAQLPEVKSHDTANTQKFLADILSMNPQFLNIVIADRTGKLWASAVPAEAPISIADRRHFKNAIATGKFSSGEYMIGRTSGKPTLIFGYPYKNKHGEVDGVITVSFNLEYFRRLLERSKLPTGASYLLIDHKGMILERGVNPTELVGKTVKPELLQQMKEGPDRGYYTGIGVDGIKRFSYYRKLSLVGEQMPYMYIRTGIPVKEVVAKANNSLFFKLALLSPFIMIAFSLVWIIGKRSIVDRVKLLEQASQRLAKGDLEVRISEQMAEDELGNLSQAFNTMADQLALREKSLQESEKRYHKFTNLTSDYVYSCSRRGTEPFRAQWMGGAVEKVTGYSQNEILAKGCWSGALHPDDAERFGTFLMQLTPGDRGENELRIITKSGNVRWVQESSSCEAGTNPGELILYGACQDITERKEIDRIKDEMISAVSHEMRTPLTAMLGYIGFILENKVDEVQTREYLDIVRKETERLNELIGNFLDLQRLRAKQWYYDFKYFKVKPLLEETVALFANVSDKHRISIDANRELPMLFGDEVALHQVLSNLLSNAVKYSPNGGSVILGANREGNCLTLWVKDEGIGIPQEEQDKIFDRFYRVDNTARRQTAGTGLGLALVREIISTHGGLVWVDSTLGQGSTFFVSLPLTPPSVLPPNKKTA